MERQELEGFLIGGAVGAGSIQSQYWQMGDGWIALRGDRSC